MLRRMLIWSIALSIISAITLGILGMSRSPLMGLLGVFGGLIGGAILGLILGLIPGEIWTAIFAVMECCSIFSVLFLGFASLIGTLLLSHNLLLSTLVSLGTMASLIGALAVGVGVDKMRR